MLPALIAHSPKVGSVVGEQAMENFRKLIERLPERHRTALVWFFKHKDTVQTWPKPLSDGTLLASKAQGIYKPKWTGYCLSIRQSLDSRYADKELQRRSDGTWSLIYAEETVNPKSRDADYANRSLIACMHNRAPIGVMRQISKGVVSRYQILGVAVVVGHYQGYFLIEGFNASGFARGLGAPEDLEALTVVQERATNNIDAFTPHDIVDAREKALASIVRRRGQPEFRSELLAAYEGKCAITGCDVVEVLEAVHIVPYRGPQTNHSSNGLLLRSDIHILFDLGLIAVDTSSMTVVISPRLLSTGYAALADKKIYLPEDSRYSPSIEALNLHRAWAGL